MLLSIVSLMWWLLRYCFYLVLAEIVARFLARKILRLKNMRFAGIMELFLRRNPSSHINMAGCVVLDEKLSEEDCSAACKALYNQCPALRCRWWGFWIMYSVSRKDGKAPPLNVHVVRRKELDSHETIECHIQNELNAPFDDSDCPVRVTLLVDDAETGRSAVIITCSHDRFDGLSATELARRFLLLVKNPDAVVCASDEDPVVSCGDDWLFLPWIFQIFLLQITMGMGELLRELRFQFRSFMTQAPHGDKNAASLSEPHLKWSRNHAAIATRILTKEQTEALALCCRNAGCTVGNVITACAMQYAPTSTPGIWASIQADFRRMWKVPSSPFLFGNLTPVVSVFLKKGGSVFDSARAVARGLKSWTAIRLAASYFSFYGVLAQVVMPMFAHRTIRNRSALPISAPSLTVSNIGLVCGSMNSMLSTRRPPLWTDEDCVNMPKLSHFVGGVSEPAMVKLKSAA